MCGFIGRGFFLLSLAWSAFGLLSCNQEVVVVSQGIEPRYPSSSYKIDVNSAGYGVFRLEGIENSDVYLAKVRNSSVEYRRNVVPGNAVTGEEQNGERALAGTVTTDTGETILRYERHWPVTFPGYERHWQVTFPEEETLMMSRSVISSPKGVNVGDREFFYVDVEPKRIAATLRYMGDYCKVWLADGYFGDGTNQVGDQITDLGEKFDTIYPIETNLLGYEYDGNGGVDGDPKVHILVYDIDGDGYGGTLGYFYPGDEFQNGSIYPYSNEAEIFYLDVAWLKNKPDAIYSTLIHEFNHMINFGIKVLGGGELASWNNEVWYTEMLSMLAEDVIGPMVQIERSSQGYVLNMRIPSWLTSYADYSVMYWPPSGSYTLPYYSSNYAFGAYLVRNFGGPTLLSTIAKSSSGGRGSVDGALRLLNGKEVDTVYALSRFYEALLYSGEEAEQRGLYSFDKTVSDRIGPETYTFKGFDIWGSMSNEKGPLIREYAKIADYATPINSVQLYTDDAWKGKSGILDIRLLNVSPDADYYVTIKNH
jgi:hypothetical protein